MLGWAKNTTLEPKRQTSVDRWPIIGKQASLAGLLFSQCNTPESRPGTPSTNNVKCTAVESYADNPVKDYGSVFGGLFTSTVIGALAPIKTYAEGGHPKAPHIQQSIELPSVDVKETAATVTISCHAEKKDDVGVQQKVVVHYGSIDLFSGSLGAIASTLGKKSYGVITTDRLTKGSDGTPITASKIGVTSSSNMQFVPIGLVNFNYMGSDKYNLNAQFGVGVNPNGSSTNVEYFLSPLAFSTHHIYFSPGVHIAQSERISGGFTQGEAVSSSFSVPTTWKTTYKFGVTISFKPYK